jgi:hypothetical protein
MRACLHVGDSAGVEGRNSGSFRCEQLLLLPLLPCAAPAQGINRPNSRHTVYCTAVQELSMCMCTDQSVSSMTRATQVHVRVPGDAVQAAGTRAVAAAAESPPAAATAQKRSI